MGRWEPDARERLTRAAMDLFGERGFAQTTAGDIAERAGVTERTFFRHFTDKREVLFDGSETMTRSAHDAALAAPAELSAFDAALAGIVAATAPLEDRREHAVRRSRIVEANPTLRERELLKLAGMTEALADALRSRGATGPTADLAAHSAVTVFHVAFAQWVSLDRPGRLSTAIARTAKALRAVT
jgi:AcrR family transcriptional regulator